MAAKDLARDEVSNVMVQLAVHRAVGFSMKDAVTKAQYLRATMRKVLELHAFVLMFKSLHTQSSLI